MTRPRLTPWYQSGGHYQMTIRSPYAELEIYPDSDFDGWRWLVARIGPTGRFHAVASGFAETLTRAKSAALDAAESIDTGLI